MKKLILLLIILVVLDFLSCFNIRSKITKSLVMFNGASGSVVKCTYNNKKHLYDVNVLTCYHVVEDPSDIDISLLKFDKYGRYELVEKSTGNSTSILIKDSYLDFAILHFETKNYYDPIKINTSKIKLLDKVYIVGTPSRNFWITEGSISSLNIRPGFFGTNAPIYFGNSGGPCLNSRGEQIGMAYSVVSAISIMEPISIYHMSIISSLRDIKGFLGNRYYKFFK